MSYVNKVILVGNLGADPEANRLPNGDFVTNLRIATTDKYKDKASGEWKEETEWHRVALFGRLATIAREHLSKGAPLYLVGALRTRKWQTQDGTDRYCTEIVAHEMQVLGDHRSEPAAPEGHESPTEKVAQTGKAASPPQPPHDDSPEVDPAMIGMPF